MMTNIVECAQTPEALQLDMPLEVVFAAAERHHHAAPCSVRRKADPMPHNTVAVVGAAETTKLGVIPDLSQIQLHADAALNAMADCGLKPKDIDGIATAERNAGADRALPGHHADLGRRHLGRRLSVHDPRASRRGGDRGGPGEDHPDHPRRKRQVADRQPAALGAALQSLDGQFEQPFGPMGPPSHVHHSGAALYEDLWRDGRADRPGLRRAARMGGEEPARDVPQSDHRRGCAGSAA